MSAVFMEVLAKGVALLLFTLLLVRFLGGRSPENRCVLWFGSAMALLVLPIATATAPQLGFSVLPEMNLETGLGSDSGQALGSIWLLGVLLGLAWLARSHLLILQQRRVSTVCSDPRLLRILATCARAQSLARPPELRLGGEPMSPFTAGSRRPWIYLPESSTCWSDEVLESVLAHECSHIRLRHWLTRCLSEFALLLNWPNPLAWMMHNRCVGDQELSCDDRALSSGIEGTRYASDLLQAARHLRQRPVPALAMSGYSSLRGRISRALESLPPPRSWAMPRVHSTTAVMLLAGLLLGGMRSAASSERSPPAVGSEVPAGELFGPHGLFGPNGLLGR